MLIVVGWIIQARRALLSRQIIIAGWIVIADRIIIIMASWDIQLRWLFILGWIN